MSIKRVKDYHLRVSEEEFEMWTWLATLNDRKPSAEVRVRMRIAIEEEIANKQAENLTLAEPAGHNLETTNDQQ